MNLVSLLPLLAALALVIMLLVSVVTLFVRYQHPWRIFQSTISAASMVAVIGIVGIVPDSMWWAPWLLTLAYVAGVLVACRRLLVRNPPAEPTKRQAKHLSAPHPLNLGTEVAIYLALLVIALYAG